MLIRRVGTRDKRTAKVACWPPPVRWASISSTIFFSSSVSCGSNVSVTFSPLVTARGSQPPCKHWRARCSGQLQERTLSGAFFSIFCANSDSLSMKSAIAAALSPLRDNASERNFLLRVTGQTKMDRPRRTAWTCSSRAGAEWRCRRLRGRATFVFCENSYFNEQGCGPIRGRTTHPWGAYVAVLSLGGCPARVPAAARSLKASRAPVPIPV